MFTPNLPKVLLLILFLPFSMLAQTSDELRQKYKITSAVESFEVRKGIIATVLYSENGEAVEVLIKPRLFYTNDLSNKEMPFKVFEEIINEFVPMAKRGKLCGEADTVSGRNHYVYTTYENVSLYSVVHNMGADNATASMIQIRWEKVYCPSATSKPPSNNSFNRSGVSLDIIENSNVTADASRPVNSGVRR